MYPGAPKHPIFSGSTFGLISGEKPLYQPQVATGHEGLAQALKQMGLQYEETSGKYAEPERSYIIHGPTVEQMKQLGKMFGQESVVHSQNGQHRLVYTNGENEGKYHPAQMQTPVEHFEQPPQDFYTAVPGQGYMRINFDWNKTQSMEQPSQQAPLQPPQPVSPQAPPAAVPAQKSEREFDLGTAAHLAKNAVAQLLASQAPVKAHPHAYDWHDGHTDHHQQDLAGPQLPGLRKDEVPHPTNDQAAGVGVDTYKKFALPYGNVQPGNASDLTHYKYHGKLPEIEKLVQDHGFKAYYAGGKYGKPDLANKNYNTGHLMVYDPTPDSGASFGHEEYTKGWRQIHELAHALTYPELNKVYGEGRRIGKLGTHRTMNEALRAVHWEWLAAHKQRELSKQVGVHVNDQDFNRELNTVMHDAAHRAVTGKFTEPSGEGFVPHAHHVPLHVALQMVRDAGHEMGLKGMHETIKKAPMQKSLPLKSPAAAGVTRAPAAQPAAPAPAAAPALHNNLQSFHAALKQAGPPGSPGHTKLLASHASHTPLLQDLGRYGAAGSKIVSAMNTAANAPANAGPQAGMKVTAKSEPNLSKAEGDLPVAEKTYTVEEANAILLKATNEKVATFAKEIQLLKERELKKALIPPHKHNESAQASMAAEDIPPGKLNPKGLDKNIGSTAAAPGSMNDTPDSAMAMSEGMCKTHGGPLTKCGCGMKKADLVAENGKRTENHSVAGAKDPKPTKEIERGSKKDPGSGGIKLPGSKLKKAADLEKGLRSAAGGLMAAASLGAGMAADMHTASTRAAVKPPAVSAPAAGVKLPGAHLKGSKPAAAPIAKAGAPPMAKPPSGKNMGTAVPTSAPKPPAAPTMKAEIKDASGKAHSFDDSKIKKLPAEKSPDNQKVSSAFGPGQADGIEHTRIPPKPTLKAEDLDMEKGVDKIVVHGSAPKPPPKGADYSAAKEGNKAVYETKKTELAKVGLPAAPKAQMAQHANVVGSKAAAVGGAPAAGPAAMPSPGAHAARASGFQAAAAGAFQPKGPVHSGLELASPKAAGVTRGAPKPAAPAPAPNAAKPAGAKPGIFGRLLGNK